MTDPTDTAQLEAESERLRRAQAGDEDAFGELMQSHYERVFRTVVGIVRHEQDARDVCQEIWISVWKNLKTFRGEAQFSTWLHPIAVRRAVDHLRKRKKWLHRFLPFLDNGAEHVAEDIPQQGLDPRREAERSERSEQFERALLALPEKQRTVLVLREVEGLSYEKISETLHCRVGTVMSRLFSARRLLAQKLERTP